MKNKLVVFIKNPEKGKVKTRLAKTVGDDVALKVYRQLLNYTRAVTLQVEADRHLYYSKEIQEDNWPDTSYTKHQQHGANLGDRMLLAFQQQFAAAPSTKVVIIGSDCAELTKDLINQAFTQLDHQDVVIGPAKDGGYYLLGMNQLLPFLFQEKSWSQPTLIKETIQSIKENGHTYFLLTELSDVDEEKDWRAVKDRLDSY